MKSAETFNQCAIEQYGSRKRHKAIDQAVNKCLTFKILRQKRMAGALCANNALSCYDRICHTVASLNMQQQGVPESAVVCMLTTFQNMEHTMRTAYRDSKSTYGGAIWKVPMQGIGQGNGAGPSIWAVVSTPALNMLQKAGYGACFKTAIVKTQIRIVEYSFVDDTDIIQTARQLSDSSQAVIADMQQAMGH